MAPKETFGKWCVLLPLYLAKGRTNACKTLQVPPRRRRRRCRRRRTIDVTTDQSVGDVVTLPFGERKAL